MTIQFPNKQELTQFLEEQLKDIPWMKEKNITGIVADAFADQAKEPIGVDLGVMLALCESPDVDGFMLQIMSMSISEVLKNYPSLKGRVTQD